MRDELLEILDLELFAYFHPNQLIIQQWFVDFGEYLDILAVSCDSFDEEVNQKIGRHAKGKNHLQVR